MFRDPFSRGTFAQTWIRHFSPGKPPATFPFIAPLSFFKPTPLPLYVNTGRNLTKGSAYILSQEAQPSFRKKTFLIYDVASHLHAAPTTLPKDLGCYPVPQYPGFLIDLSGVESLDTFMKDSFSKSGRYKLQKYRKRLETSFDIRYTMYYGEIAKNTYTQLFDSFRELLEKRFTDKQVANNNLDPAEWEFYKEVAYPMILEKNAGLFVIYNGDKPISVTLNYFWGDTMIDAITVFDTAYAKFHPGSINIMALLEWCLKNGIRIFDFSKGYFDYKQRWATRTYPFEYHILFDKKSIRARALALGLRTFFTTKQWLRDRNLNETLHRLKYRFQSGKATPLPDTAPYALNEMDTEFHRDEWTPVTAGSELHQIHEGRFDFLYLSMEKDRDVQVFKSRKEEGLYLLEGRSKKMMLRMSPQD